jgi:lupus La protein
MSDDSKPVEAVEALKADSGAPKVESEAPKVDSETPKIDSEAPKTTEKGEEKSEETAEVKKDEAAEKNDESKSERKSRSQSPRNDRRNNDRNGRVRDNRNGGDRKPFKNHKDNIKSKYELKESSDADEIRKQVEFYFSDSNLCGDKFLFTQTGGPENKPVPISVIHSFKRMRHFQPFSAVVAALKESKTLEVVGNDEVKRKTPLPLDKDVNFEDSAKLIEDRSMARSLYAKGFGEEKATTQLDIEAFFNPYGPINMVKLRRNHPENTFKGSVFVEFESPEVMQAFMDLETKPQWEGTDLKFTTKKEYCEGKINDINAGKIRGSERDSHRGNFRGRGGDRDRGRGGRGRGRGRGGRGNFDRRDRDRGGDDRDWKSRRDNDQRKDRGGDLKPSEPDVDDRLVPHCFSPCISIYSANVFQQRRSSRSCKPTSDFQACKWRK